MRIAALAHLQEKATWSRVPRGARSFFFSFLLRVLQPARFSLRMEMSRLTRDGTVEPVSRDQILRHVRGQGIFIFPVQLTTSRIGNLTRLIHTLLYQILRHARGQGNIIFPVQLTTSRIGNLNRLIHTLLYVMTIHTYIHICM